MNSRRLLIHTGFLLLLPVIVAWLGISVAGATMLIALALVWRWGISLATWVAPEKHHELELNTISASHFVEKVRWCMDRLELDYVERPSGGALGAFFLGRTVPMLTFRTGAVRSSIGNSSEILRYLWGRYSAETTDRANFLATDSQRLELERKLDRCGVDLQVWVYYHILPHKDLTLRAWGIDNPAIPFYQRKLLILLHPLLSLLIRKSFRINEIRHKKAIEHIDALLSEVEALLDANSKSILGGDEINYSDITFAAIMGLWLQPDFYGGGQADSVRIEPNDRPPAMNDDIERWCGLYPLSTRFIEDMYRMER